MFDLCNMILGFVVIVVIGISLRKHKPPAFKLDLKWYDVFRVKFDKATQSANCENRTFGILRGFCR